MKFKNILFIVLYSVVIALITTLSNGIINPFGKNQQSNRPLTHKHSYVNFKQRNSLATSGQEKFDIFEKLIPLHSHLAMPGPHDWLFHHHEDGQPYADFIKQDPVIPDQNRKIIYITLLGSFTPEQKKIVEITADFISLYYVLPVKFTRELSLKGLPDHAKRVHKETKDKQILSTYVIEEVLKPVFPEDAFCLIAFTAEDLWPGEGWNFVFGQASMQDRIGVWSIYRNGDPAKSKEDFQLFLLRTLKTGTHEVGHMFSFFHCIYFQCNMNGSNHRRESDMRPLWLCPVCLKKLQWANSFDLGQRYRNLVEFCEKHHLTQEAEFYKKSLNILTQY